MKKLAIVTTHPIQYNAPWFRKLNEGGRIFLKVFYTWSQIEKEEKYDPGFGKTIHWDIPLLDGYEYTFVLNISKKPGSHHRNGIVNPNLNEIIEVWKPDALLVLGWNFDSHWKCIRYFKGRIPIIFRGDSTFLRKQPRFYAFIRTLYLRWIYRHIDYALYVGSQNYYYYRRCGLLEKQMIYAPHAIDNNRFSRIGISDLEEVNLMKEAIGIRNKNLTILFAAKWETIKNPMLFLDFANRFRKLPVNFIMAGNGPLDSEVRLRASTFSNLFLIDFQNQSKMPLLYRTAHFFFMSSDSETWGLAVNEAMACSRGIIVRNTCGCAYELVRDGENGYVFDQNDMESLYQKIIALIDRPELWSYMGARSFELIQDFHFERIVDSVEGLMNRHFLNISGHA